ncbi:hypothetical protein [Roseomonas populi]|uniref:Uncharacterized protein n=1 Tax=Roseomonas populi TaxID=3121582 RepID=A0ABT1X6T3_9PROT|nr:hypothetical protein [Roseomonas pecuniae]MCR0983803.1 hypothetical protein [Roseomonas pecuniae]
MVTLILALRWVGYDIWCLRIGHVPHTPDGMPPAELRRLIEGEIGSSHRFLACVSLSLD